MDEIFVVNFNEKPRRGLPDNVLFSDNPKELRSALWQGTPEGRTALYDAIEMSLHQLDFGRQAKKALVVISDGGDNHSTHTEQQVMHDVLSSLATIYTVGIYDEDDPERNEGVLKDLAHVSGGVFYHPMNLEDVVPICRQIAKDIRSRYTIGYVPSVEGKIVRLLKLVASSADHPKLIVRTRTSYVFPDQAADSNEDKGDSTSRSNSVARLMDNRGVALVNADGTVGSNLTPRLPSRPFTSRTSTRTFVSPPLSSMPRGRTGTSCLKSLRTTAAGLTQAEAEDARARRAE